MGNTPKWSSDSTKSNTDGRGIFEVVKTAISGITEGITSSIFQGRCRKRVILWMCKYVVTFFFLLYFLTGDRYFYINDVNTQVEFKSHQWFGATVRSHGNSILVRMDWIFFEWIFTIIFLLNGWHIFVHIFLIQQQILWSYTACVQSS